MLKKLCFAIGILALCSSSAMAKFPIGSTGSPPVAPVLQNVTVHYGDSTPSGLGSVRLSSQDLNYNTGLNPSGLDLLVSGTPASWTMTFVSGRSSTDFNLIAANTVEGAGAKTPNVSSTGVGHLTGSYVFNVTTKDAGGNVSNTATFTYVIDSNTTSYGTGDRTFSNWPAGFGNTPGARFIFSTGFVHDSGRLIFSTGFTNPVIFTWADVTKPGALVELELNGANNFPQHLSFTGASLSGLTAILSSTGSGTGSADDIHMYFNATLMGNNQYNWMNMSNTGGGTVSNSDCDYCATGITPQSNYTYSHNFIRHYANNGVFAGNLHDVTMLDNWMVSPFGQSLGQHPDCFQRADGSTQIRLSVTQFVCAAADANQTSQGPWFGGDVLGKNANVTGYVDDGTVGHGPGKVLTLVTGSLLTGSNGSVIYSPTGSPIGATDLVTLNCGASNCLGKTTATLSLGSNINYGSSGSPVTFYGLQDIDNTWDEIAFFGNTFNGLVTGSESGTSSLTRFMYIYQANPSAGTAQPSMITANCDVAAVHLGAFNINGGLVFETYFTRNVALSGSCPGNTPPANTTISHLTQASGSNATLTAAYTTGNPETVLEAISQAAYKAMTQAQIKSTYCGAGAAKPSGPLDGGGGTWYNPFIAGGWADGTAIAGC